MKLCKKCNILLSHNLFNKHSRKPDGLDIYCKTCRSEYRNKNKKRNALITKKWRIQNKKKAYDNSRNWRLKNPYKNKIAQDKYRTKHKYKYLRKKRDKIKEKEWRHNNKDKIRQYKKNRRAKLLGSMGNFSLSQWHEKCLYHGWKCYYCHKILDCKSVTQDHRKPISKGGTNHLSNIVPCCSMCNSRKHIKTEQEYISLINLPHLTTSTLL